MVRSTRRGFFGLLGGLAALPVVGRLVPAAAAPSAFPRVTIDWENNLYGRGPMMNALPVLRADFNKLLAEVRASEREFRVGMADE